MWDFTVWRGRWAVRGPSDCSNLTPPLQKNPNKSKWMLANQKRSSDPKPWSSLPFWKKQGKPPKKARIFSRDAEPLNLKIPGKEGKNAQKSKEIPCSEKSKEIEKARKGRSGQPPVFFQKHCRTNGGRTALQMGGVLQYKWEAYCGVSLSSKFRSQESTAIQMGGILPYKLEVYCLTFWTSCRGWGFRNIAQLSGHKRLSKRKKACQCEHPIWKGLKRPCKNNFRLRFWKFYALWPQNIMHVKSRDIEDLEFPQQRQQKSLVFELIFRSCSWFLHYRMGCKFITIVTRINYIAGA